MTSTELHKRLIQAIADPGHFTPRGDDYTESIPSWSARAVMIVLDLDDDEQINYDDAVNLLKTHESTKRVLYHLVSTYQGWRNTSLGVPNEFTDNAVTLGERHLRLVEWFPEDDGWLAGPDDKSPVGSAKPNNDNVLALIDAELKRLYEQTDGRNTLLWGRKRKGWAEGVNIAHEVSVDKLKAIRDAYLVESLARETESKRRYGINNQESNDD